MMTQPTQACRMRRPKADIRAKRSRQKSSSTRLDWISLRTRAISSATLSFMACRMILWCEAEPFRLNRDQQLKFSWDHFCDVTKHKLRYFFSKDDRDDDEIYPPTKILKLIFSYAE